MEEKIRDTENIPGEAESANAEAPSENADASESANAGASSENADDTESANAGASSENADAAESAKPSMVWHGFQRKFLLWLIAAAYFARAFLILNGNIYLKAEIRAAIYAGIPLLRILDYAFAAHCAAGGVFAILSAVCRKPRILIGNNIALCAGEAAYLLLRWAITELPPVNPQGIALMLVHGLMLWVNLRYYRNRKDRA